MSLRWHVRRTLVKWFLPLCEKFCGLSPPQHRFKKEKKNQDETWSFVTLSPTAEQLLAMAWHRLEKHVFIFSRPYQLVIHETDPQSRPVVITPSLLKILQYKTKFTRKTMKSLSENSDRYWRECRSGRVDHWWHTCLVCVVLFFGFLCVLCGIMNIVMIMNKTNELQDFLCEFFCDPPVQSYVALPGDFVLLVDSLGLWAGRVDYWWLLSCHYIFLQ